MSYVPAEVPLVGNILGTILQMSTFGVLCFCLTRRTQWIKKWTRLPLAQWLILIIYVDSALFVFATSILVHGFGINSSSQVCEGGILLCLVCYMTTKIIIYYFLVERAYIVGGSRKPRLKTKLWLFNCLFMLLPYTIFVIMNFIFRITYINEKGVCIIGMEKIAMLPLIIFEVIVNIYLTLLFIIPLRGLHSYKTNANPALSRMAFRSFIGSCATLTTSVVNLTILMVLKGEPGWICLMCCNADILFCVLVLHWVTSKEQKEEDSAFRSSNAATGGVGVKSSGGGGHTATIRSYASKSRRTSLREGVEKSANVNVVVTRPDSALDNGLNKHATITTECKGKTSPGRSTRHFAGSGWDASEPRSGIREDEVELNNIRVQTIQTREVEVDVETERKMSAGASTIDDWVGSRRGVEGERIV
ncbi:hypothetical protein DE146DRAFT_112745 [Phaeosphaeria sp. MPI-PUGE-AT-0046c]|nr:hypothetical protein DE146DRAFT_112745 [Phaeosphaeria sp. MPI-PUGE-AT-0046c]